MAEKHRCGSTERVLTEIETCKGCGAVTKITPLIDGEAAPETKTKCMTNGCGQLVEPPNKRCGTCAQAIVEFVEG